MKRRIHVIVDSDSNLKQCKNGFRYLNQMQNSKGEDVIVIEVLTMNIHGNTEDVTDYLKDMNNQFIVDQNTVRSADADEMSTAPYINIIIACAGCPAHLPSMIDTYLRYTLNNDKTIVIGVAAQLLIEDHSFDQNRIIEMINSATQLSISEVPSTQVIYKDDEGLYIGIFGFGRACEYAATGDFPTIEIPEKQPMKIRTLQEALHFIYNS